MGDTAMNFAEHNLVATYRSPGAARAALTLLERNGVEAGDIELFGPGVRMGELPVTNDEQRDADVAMLGAVGRRAAIGGVLGAVVGGLVGLGLAAMVSGDTALLWAGALGGVIVGGALGFLWAVYSGLPVNEQWEETFQQSTGDTSVAVHSADPHEIEVALAALRRSDAVRLATCGPDGQLRDVA